ncbi:AAA family ATPase [Fusarium albosuccineum]|uniref:AAA family ATPase n=1 Tax=Fusarium albosuccineum TaxID=1237068 RepID=A0A8H4L279_9HYPO|nr:AAA family ATPase [Fusarium albosuccineum]
MDSDRDGGTDSSREDQSDFDRGDEAGSDNEDSDREENVLFISSTISRDDTQSKASKEQAMLAQLTDNLKSGNLILNRSGPVHVAGLGPLRHPMPPYPGMPAHMLLQNGMPQPSFRPIPPPGSLVLPRSLRPPEGNRRSHLKANKNAKWRQNLLDRRLDSVDSATGDDPDLENGGPPSQSQRVPETNGVEAGGGVSSHPISELRSNSSPTADIAKPIPAASQAPSNEEDDNVRNHTGQYRIKPLEYVAGGGRVEEASQITVSLTPGADAESETCEETTNSEITGPGDDDRNTILSDLGLAESLSYIAKKHLGIDMLNQSAEAARFGGYLLDTIEMLDHQVSYLRADDSSSNSESEDEEEEEVQAPHSQVLHRIYCSDASHDHDNMIYEDEPTITNDRVIGGKVLTGRIAIQNLTRYLDQHPSICFIVFKEHNCAIRQKATRKLQSNKRLEKLGIVSPNLQKALEQVAEFSPYTQEAVNDHVKRMNAPYDFLFHHRKQLATLEKQSDTYSAVLTPLREFLDQNYETEYQSAEALFQRGRVTSLHVGKLFKPNQIVISQGSDSHCLEAHVLSSIPYKEKDKIVLEGWSWRYNGTELLRKPWYDTMNPVPDEEIAITELPMYPETFARESVLKKLEARGGKFWSMKDRQFSTYTGFDWNQDHLYVEARFMIDMSTYQKMHPTYHHGGEEPLKFDTWPVTIHRHKMLSKQLLMLLPPMTYGFNLQEKRWVSLSVEKIEPAKWNKKAFDRLVLDSKTKDLIYALVDVQTSKDKKMDDIIAGKGNGLIILLHGSPGTGKTLTAESVAEIAEKPLYRVTCGDIGTEAQEVEKYLQSVLHLGKIWDCVLLMDEADVFLEERTMADLQRNSLVSGKFLSIFLRILEYYEGILILTSNRVGTFDEAFKSRIQVAIHYDTLTKLSRKQIWQNFFDMIEEANEDVNMPELERRLDELAAEDMNGRQIRNALLTSRQLAKHRKERLGWEHLSQVIKTSRDFNKYLKAVRGHSDEQWAREENYR